MSSLAIGVDEHVLADVRRRLSRAAAKVLPSWTSADRDDVVQQAMLRVLRHLERRPGDVPAGRWLHRAAHSAMVDELRKRRSSRLEPMDSPPDVADGHPGPDARLTDAELGDAIRDCLEHSVHGSRRPAVSLWMLGNTIRDCSEQLGIDPKKADNLVYRGLAELRDCLTGKGLAP